MPTAKRTRLKRFMQASTQFWDAIIGVQHSESVYHRAKRTTSPPCGRGAVVAGRINGNSSLLQRGTSENRSPPQGRVEAIERHRRPTSGESRVNLPHEAVIRKAR